jgi:spore germination protein PC
MCIQAQEKRITVLEQTIQKLQDDIKQVREKPAIHVDTIEYKFDQLKVETLEGTLNIGLNPSDLAGIEDFAIQNQALTTPFSPKAQMQRSMKIEEAIYRYLETDLPQIIEATQKNLNIAPSESYLTFIKQDIIKQLPNRIEYHLKANTAKERSPEHVQPHDEIIVETLKQEIQNGVYVFLSHVPESLKGMNT